MTNTIVTHTTTYNLLDLPQQETVGSSVVIDRKYGADGMKLQEKVTTNSNSVLTRDYVGSLIYENGTLKKILFDGGYVDMTGSAPAYRFFLTDHLGSVRVVAAADGTVMQVNHYYPYGGLMTDPRHTISSPAASDSRYRFSSKELSEESGEYDFGARFLDPVPGRFITLDPLAEKYYNLSPYAYCAGNPINYIDQNGMDPIYAKNFWGKIILIGDDGQNGSRSYLVNGSVAREVKRVTRNNDYYTGNLSESKKVIHIPTGERLEGIMQSYEDTKKSQKENGGHSNYGETSVTRWDEGPAAMSFTDKDGNQGAKASLQMFIVNGKNIMPSNASNVEMWWHIHPKAKVNGISLGNSTPSEADFRGQRTMTNRGYKGNTFVIGVRSGTVTFFDKDSVLETVKWNDFLRMGGQQL